MRLAHDINGELMGQSTHAMERPDARIVAFNFHHHVSERAYHLGVPSERIRRIGDGAIPGTGTFCEHFDFVLVSDLMLSQTATLPTVMTM